jgi:hypothetical protein
MCYTGLFKRFVPFALTFAAGLFIASFFVTIPTFSGRSERRIQRFQEIQQLQLDKDVLRQKNADLEEKYANLEAEVERLRRTSVVDFDRYFQDAVPTIEGDAPHHHPPAPPKRPKQPRFETLQ